jgi:lipoprotein NlpD
MRETNKMHRVHAHGWKWMSVAAALLAACSSPQRAPAPVVDRSPAPRAVVAATPAADAPKVPPGAENAGKAGYHTVKPGDTLIRVALDYGQNWRDVARWNNLDNPNVIEVGQVLRVAPPGASTDVAVRPIAPPAPAVSSASAPRPAASAPTLPPVNTPPATASDEAVSWMWPTGPGDPVIAGFDEEKNKGLDIGGKPGDPVFAAADGRVVYAGAGLRGYGNLIILKHNNTYLTAYAHNQALLVKEDQSVRRGQKIAEMGSSDADRVKLHFEIRRQGKPVDPTKFLPPR